jgi:hypothetical protein
LKPCQVEALSSADAFASRRETPLNGYLTIKFSEFGHPLKEFQAGTKRLSEWHRRWGGELRWLYVWEAIGGYHIHALAHIPRGAWADFRQATMQAFTGHDVLLKSRTYGQFAMCYLCKGTDLQTHWRLRGATWIRAKAQGVITWKRCGYSQSLSRTGQDTAFPIYPAGVYSPTGNSRPAN